MKGVLGQEGGGGQLFMKVGVLLRKVAVSAWQCQPHLLTVNIPLLLSQRVGGGVEVRRRGWRRGRRRRRRGREGDVQVLCKRSFAEVFIH